MRQIIDKILNGLRLRLNERDIEVELTEPAYGLLVARGYDRTSGARAMERTIDRLVTQPLADALLQGRFGDGTRLTVDAVNGELQFLSRTPGSHPQI